MGIKITAPLTDDDKELAYSVLRAGKLVVMPTDTVYGIGAYPFDDEAMKRLLAAKGRGNEAPSPLLVGNIEDVDRLAQSTSSLAQCLMKAFWPGALTLILPTRTELSRKIGSQEGTVALRMPDEPTILALLRRSGPLAVTSANKHGKDPATSIQSAIDSFGADVALYIDAGDTPGNLPSTIVRCHDGISLDDTCGGNQAEIIRESITILRQGVIPAEALYEAIRSQRQRLQSE